MTGVRTNDALSPLERLLKNGALLYGLGLAIHTADHVRRGVDVITPQVEFLGALSTTAGVLTIALVLKRHQRAPFAAAFVGLQVALGTAAVHMLPRWSAFSDAFPGGQAAGVTPLSYLVVLVEIAGALVMGIAGVRLLQRGRAA